MTHLEHIGIAVEDPAPVRQLLLRLLGIDVYKVESVPSENVTTHFLAAGRTKIELLESEQADSSIGRFVARRGGGLHHLAFEVDDIEETWGRALAIGLTPINASPKEGADGKQIFFLHPKETHGVLVEICQAARFAGQTVSIPMPHGKVGAFDAGPRDAPVLMLFHEAGRSSLEDFGRLMSRLSTDIRLIAFDAPGHGDSGAWPPSSHFLRAADKHARAVLDYFNVDDAIVAGVGIGAAAAAALAVNEGNRVAGLALINPNLLEDSSSVDEAAETVRTACGDSNAELAASLVSTLPQAADAVVTRKQLAETDCAKLIVCTREDRMARSFRLRESLPHASMAFVPDWSDHTTILSQILLDFVRQAES